MPNKKQPPDAFKAEPPQGIVTCSELIDAGIEKRMSNYEKIFRAREDRLIEKMDELIKIVSREYTTNKMLIILAYVIDVITFGLIAYLHTKD